MSATDRTITGLPPRPRVSTRAPAHDVSVLLKHNRNDATAEPVPQAAEMLAAQQPAEPEKKPSNKPTTVYIAPDVLKQARLAFKATQSAEADRNWSHFVEKALADATQRRAAQHNDGNEFMGEDKPLPPGRPLAD